MNGDDLVTRYPALLNAVSSLGEPPETALKRISTLLQRHGQSVANVMRNQLSEHRQEPLPETSLPGLYGALQREAIVACKAPPAEPTKDETYDLLFDRRRKLLMINGSIPITGATYILLDCLAEETLKGAGQGLAPLDYPMLEATKLASRLSLESDEAVRQRINRSRTHLGTKFASAGLVRQEGKDLIENLPWHGYRLKPDRVRVRIKTDS
jgi:hypothetical protein